MFNQYNDIVTVDDLCECYQSKKTPTDAIKALHYGRVWKIPKQAVIDLVLENSSMGISS